MSHNSSLDRATECCGTCAHFKRSFPNSPRLHEIGSCYWKLPKGIKLPDSWQKRGMKDSYGKDCAQWTPIAVTVP